MHLLLLVVAGSETFFPGQIVQSVLPVVESEYWPDEQLLQAPGESPAGESLYLPRAQGRQEDSEFNPFLSPYVPDGQFLQLLEPSWATY